MMRQFFVAMGYLALKDTDTSRYNSIWGFARVVKDLRHETSDTN